MRIHAKKAIEKNTWVVWNKRGIAIDTITNPLITFVVRIKAHKFFQSSRLNSLQCIDVDLGYKRVKKDHSYDLSELQLQ